LKNKLEPSASNSGNNPYINFYEGLKTKNQVISNTGFESPWLTKGESCHFFPLWSNGPQLHGGNSIGFVPASRGGVYPVPQNALYVSAGMNVLKFPKGKP